MKKTKRNWHYYVLAFCLFFSMLCSACGGASGNNNTTEKIKVDFEKEEDFEAALNAGQDLTGKTVTFIVNSVHPNSLIGHNLWSGEHLNFVSDSDPGIKSGDIVTVKVTKVSSSLGSWIIHYELIQSSASQSTSTKQASTPTTTEDPKAQDQTIRTMASCGSYIAAITTVKSLDYIQLEKEKESVPENQEVIYVFADIMNASSTPKKITNSVVSLYYDSNKAAETVTTASDQVCLDGYKERWTFELDPVMTSVVLRGFIVEKGWKELKVFVEDTSWIIYPDDLGDYEEFKDKMWFMPDESNSPTKEGKEVYSKDYSIIYDGFTIFAEGDSKYAIFKFTVNNTSSKTIDYSIVGYDMRGYLNRRPLADATYMLDKTIDKYINVFDVDDIKPGMSAKVYVAFPTEVDTGFFTCAYDVGFGGISKLLAMVHAESK